jgi:RND superfamily putative drug exporter
VATGASAYHRLGLALAARHRQILLISAVIVALSVGALVEGGRLTTGSIDGLESAEAQRGVDQVRGFPLTTTFLAIFESDQLAPDDEPFQAEVAAAVARARQAPGVRAVVTAEDVPDSVGLLMSNGEARAQVVYVTLDGTLGEAKRAYPAVRAALDTPTLRVTCTGHVPYVHDLDTTLEHDLVRAELYSLPLALLVLVLVFRTVLAALLPVIVGATSVLAAIALVLVLSHFGELAQYTLNVCSLIGLGVSIDYALFIVSRYREELAAGHARPEALARTLATAGRVVVYSGVAVASGLLGLVSFRGSYLEAMGIGGVLVVLCAVLGSLTLLPALLVALGPRIGPMPPRPETAALWTRVVRAVMAHPVVVLVPTLAVLIVMGLPFSRLDMAAADVRVLPADVEARRGHARLLEAFPELAAERVAVSVRFPSAPALTAERARALYTLTQRLAKLDGVSRVESVVSPVLALGGTAERAAAELLAPSPELAGAVNELKRLMVHDDVVVLYAVTELPPHSERARDIVRQIRAERAVADGVLTVGGPIAHDLDTTAFILGHAPRAVGIVVGATIIALFLLLGSILLPLKALAMNVLSIAGSFGALVWVFQDGHLFVSEARPVEPTLPILLFCTLFGLSMDYEVMMLGRIKEAYDQHHDNERAVSEGLAHTGGLITSAAAIMVAVFGAFALGRVVLIQAVGFGMALAVAIDATLVRVLLVPATMRLFGDLNWWLPAPLVRLRHALGFGPGRGGHG